MLGKIPMQFQTFYWKKKFFFLKKKRQDLEGMASLAAHELERALEQRPRVPKRGPLVLPLIAISAATVDHHDVEKLGRLRRRRHRQRPKPSNKKNQSRNRRNLVKKTNWKHNAGPSVEPKEIEI